MADNIAVTPGTGATIATDDVGGIHYHKVKIDAGGDGASAPVGGDTTNGLDVDVTRVRDPLVEATGSLAATGTLFTQDCSSLAWASFQLKGTWVGTVIFETSNDNSNWRSSAFAEVVGGLHSVGATANGIWYGPVGAKWFRLRVSAYTSGTVEAVGEFRSFGAASTNLNDFYVIGGIDANDDPISQQPLSGGGRASDAVPTAVSADGDVVHEWRDRRGAAKTVMVDDAGDSIMDGTNNALRVNLVTPTTLPVSATDLDIRNLDVAQDDVRVGGMAAHDSTIADNPVAIGGRSNNALPAAVSADGEAVWAWMSRNGAMVIAAPPHIGLNSDPYNLVHEAAQYTTTQTSTVLIAGGASEKLVVTKVQIQAGGTVAGTLQLYFGTAAFSRGTSRAIFDGEFAPSATLKPGVVMDGPFISGTNGDDLLVTTSAAINPLTINVWYYVVV